MAKVEGVQRATGRGRAEWFELLDSWGAAGRPYREIAAWLTGEHGLSKWWAQKLIVEYEQARGIRPPGIRRDGTFEVSASKTVAAPAELVYRAFVDGRRRARWLPGAELSLRTKHPNRAARFDWGDGSTRVSVLIADKGPAKSTVAVSHGHIPNAGEAARTKGEWKKRLADLSSYLGS